MPPATTQKYPVPTEDQQRQARQELRDAVGDDLSPASTPNERGARLARLGRLADEVSAEPHVLYVVLDEAYRQASDLRMFDDAAKVIDRLVDRFEIDEVAAGSKLLRDFAQIARLPAERMKVAASAMQLAEKAYRQEKFDDAAAMATLAETQATKAGDAVARTQARERSSEYKRAVRAKDTFEKAQAALTADPNDPRAHATAGRYLTLFQGDFSAGVAHLAKSDEPRLKSIAERDLADPSTVEEQVALAEAWFEVAGADAELVALYARARHWYLKAKPSALGLTLAKINSRVAQIDELEKAGKFLDRASPASLGSAASGNQPTLGPRPPWRPPSNPQPAPGGPLFSMNPSAAALNRMNQLAPTAWRAVLRQADSRKVVQHPSISIQTENGEVAVVKQRSTQYPSIHLINETLLSPEFTVRMSVTFHSVSAAAGGTPLPYLGVRSVDGQTETYIHLGSLAFAKAGPREFVLTRRGGAVSIMLDGQPQRVYQDNNSHPAQVFIHLNDEASLTIHRFVIEG